MPSGTRNNHDSPSRCTWYAFSGARVSCLLSFPNYTPAILGRSAFCSTNTLLSVLHVAMEAVGSPRRKTSLSHTQADVSFEVFVRSSGVDLLL